jgi:hypothetical protein
MEHTASYLLKPASTDGLLLCAACGPRPIWPVHVGGTCVCILRLHHSDGESAWGFSVVFGVGGFCIKVDVLTDVIVLPYVRPGEPRGLDDALLQQGW